MLEELSINHALGCNVHAQRRWRKKASGQRMGIKDLDLSGLEVDDFANQIREATRNCVANSIGIQNPQIQKTSFERTLKLVSVCCRHRQLLFRDSVGAQEHQPELFVRQSWLP